MKMKTIISLRNQAIKFIGLLLISLVAINIFCLNTHLLVYAADPTSSPKEPEYKPGISEQRREIEFHWAYDKTAICSAAGSSSASTSSGVDELEGHKLPAATGGTGLEESINESGRIPSGGAVTFSGFASLGQNYRDYYITMRWRYATWAWSGKSQKGPEDVGWYSAQPRKVLVTNPQNGKSIVAAILESGQPLDWNRRGKGNPPSYWQGYVDGTPDGYKGRVAGFPPVAFDYLGDGADIQRYKDGSGPDLIYKWADQNAEPGPANVAGGTAPSSTGSTSTDDNGCGGGQASGGQGVGPDGFVFPLQTTRSTLLNNKPKWCNDNDTNCHHHYNAADIFPQPVQLF